MRLKLSFKFLVCLLLFAQNAHAWDLWVDGKSRIDADIVEWDGMPEPSTAPTGSARVYFDSTSNTLKKSENGGAYEDLGSGGGSLTIQDIDGDPSQAGITTIRFTNGAVTIDSATQATVTTGAGGGGDVSGPASSVDNEIVRFDSTTGKVIQAYTSGGPTISDTGTHTATQPIVLDDTSLQIQEGVDTMTLTVPALTAARAVTLPDAAGEISLLGQSISDAEVANDITIDAATTAGTVTTAAQPTITSLGTLTVLAVDNITINGNDISSTAGTDLTITPLAGQQIVLDGTIVVDAGVVTGATSITSTAFVGDLTGNADTATALAADPANCGAGTLAGGVDASGASEGCVDVWTEAENTSAAYISATLTQEEVEDFAGALVAAGTGTHTGIDVTYQDATGDIDFVVDMTEFNTLTLGSGTFTTLTFDAGASDPVITAATGALNVSTGTFSVGGSEVIVDTDIGSTVQAWDAELDTLAALTETNGNVMIVSGGAWASVAQPAIDCTNCTSIPAGTVGADHIDALTEIAQGIKTAANDTSSLVVGTAGSTGEIAEWDATGNLVDTNVIFGTMTDGKLCGYTTVGTVIDCNNDPSALGADAVGTAELDDDANTPAAGDIVIVETGAASFDYITPNAGTDITADLEEEVTEGSLADQTIVSADIKEATILYGDLSLDAVAADGDYLTLDTTGTNFNPLSAAEVLADIGAESSTSNDIDPDRLAGDTTDDNLIDEAIIDAAIARDSELHSAVTMSGTPDYITLSGQDIVRAKLDISDDTNATGGVGIDITANDFTVDLTETNTLALGSGTFTTLTFDAGASDPVITAATGALNVSTGTFSVGGSEVLVDSDIGSTVQTQDAELDTIRALTETNGAVMFVAGGVWTADTTPAIDCTDCTGVTAAHANTITWTGTPVLESGATFGFGDGTDATLTHTYANTGTDVSIAYSTGAMAVTGALSATNLSGTNTGDDDQPEAGDYAAGSIDGDDINSNLAGRSLTLTSASPDTLDADAELYTRDVCYGASRSTGIVDTDDRQSIHRTSQAATITKLWCESDQTVTLMLQVDDGTPADVDSVDLTCDATPPEDTSLNGDANLAAGETLDVAITSVASTPTWYTVCATLTYDD